MTVEEFSEALTEACNEARNELLNELIEEIENLIPNSEDMPLDNRVMAKYEGYEEIVTLLKSKLKPDGE